MYSWLQNLVQWCFAHLRIEEDRHQSWGPFRIIKHFSIFTRDLYQAPFWFTQCEHQTEDISGRHGWYFQTLLQDVPVTVWNRETESLNAHSFNRNQSWTARTLSYAQNNIYAFVCTTPIRQKNRAYRLAHRQARITQTRHLTAANVALIAFS